MHFNLFLHGQTLKLITTPIALQETIRRLLKYCGDYDLIKRFEHPEVLPPDAKLPVENLTDVITYESIMACDHKICRLPQDVQSFQDSLLVLQKCPPDYQKKINSIKAKYLARDIIITKYAKWYNPGNVNMPYYGGRAYFSNLNSNFLTELKKGGFLDQDYMTDPKLPTNATLFQFIMNNPSFLASGYIPENCKGITLCGLECHQVNETITNNFKELIGDKRDANVQPWRLQATWV